MTALNISNFIWGIADDVLRDVYVRGKYRDVILPMTVIRRLDAVLEPTKDAVLRKKEWLDAVGITNQEDALRQASDEGFYNTSRFRLSDLTSRGREQQLREDFLAYLDGFSPNVQEVLEKFEFRNQIPRLVNTGTLGFLVDKFLDRSINLSPRPVLNADGSVRIEGLDNHGMGTVFEELIRRFNEENNEEAGEHFTPRDVVQLMARLVFLPVADKVSSSTYLVYDGACGTGGMLTVAEETLAQLAFEQGKGVSIDLYGQEVNPETYAISKADLILKGEGVKADNIRYGSTLSYDEFATRTFDFMLSNPPYGKSWKSDLDYLGGKSDTTDPRFIVEHDGDPEYSLITRSSDGQMMFLANMLSKMKTPSEKTPIGSRVAEVHNGSSLFTGDAGQGESNIRRWSSRTTGWRPSSPCLSTCSTTPASPPTSGCSATARLRTARAKSSSSTPPSGSIRSARTSATRTASFPRRTSGISAMCSSPSKIRSSRRYCPTRHSATGRSLWRGP